MKQKVVPIRLEPVTAPVLPASRQSVVRDDSEAGASPANTQRGEKLVAASQAAIDALPLASGTWRVAGVPGLYVRCRQRSKSFFVQRRVNGVLVKRVLGQLRLKEARQQALRIWSSLRPASERERRTLADAFEEYLRQKELSAKTRQIYRYNFERYLSAWHRRELEDIGCDRAGVRRLFADLVARHGKATAAQTMRMFRAVYNYARKADPDLPETPTVAIELPTIKPRDWALSPEELKAWWAAVQRLYAVKRMWWLTCLLTGARRASIEALEWSDIDFERKTIRFRVTKGDRPYVVPAAERLIALLEAYRAGGEVPPSRWVFPSPRGPDRHLVNVRDDKRGVASAHHLRHTYRTTLAQLGATPDQARLLMGHSLGGDVSRGYITAPLVVESLRPLANAVAEHYATLLEWNHGETEAGQS